MSLKFKNNSLGYLRFFYSVLKYRLIVSLFLSLIVGLLDGIGMAMFMPLLQSVSSSSNDSKKSLGGLEFIIDFISSIGITISVDSILAVMVILFIIKGIFKFILLSYQKNNGRIFSKYLRYQLVERLQNLSFTGFLNLDLGYIHNTSTNEVVKVNQAMNMYFNAVQSLIMLSSYIFLAFIANPQFAVLVAIGAALSNLIYQRIYVSIKKLSIGLSGSSSQFNSYLTQAIYNFKYLKSTNYFKGFTVKLKDVINEIESQIIKIASYNAITTSIKEPLIIIIIVCVIQVQLKLFGANLSTLLLSLLLFYRALTFLLVIQNQWQSFIQNTGAIYSVIGLLNEMNGMKEVQSDTKYKVFSRKIILENVNFSYGNKNVLYDINLEMPKNKTIALVGESGSGKTTIINMLLGLIKPIEGNFLIDDINLEKYNLDSYRDKIGYISQEPVIFNDNIFNNITFWAEPTNDNLNRFWRAIELASLTSFINNLVEKELTKLGDNGILISGGQKQRISIARELYKDADILILDEATSALDSETEKVIQENIEKLHGAFTMVIVAHRLSTIKNADIIYLLENGRITASGSFKKLVSESAKFKRMVSLQEF